MRKLFLALLVLILIAGAAVFFGPGLIPSSVYRDQIAQAVEKATGRPFKIAGDVRLNLIPSVKARVEKAALGNAPGGKAEAMAEIGALDVGLELWPLLSRRAEIRNFVLNDAVIHLEVGKDGKPNWDFAKPEDGAAKESAKPGEAQGLSELSLGDVRLVNGHITYDNLQTGDSYALDKINAKIELPSLDKPFKLDGDGVYRQEKLAVALTLEKPRATLEHGTTPITIKLDGTPLSASFAGEVSFAEKSKFSGDTKLSVPSVRALASWLGSPIEGGKGFGAMAIAGHVSFAGDMFAFTKADLSFDQIHATGNLKGDLSGKVPFVSGKLSTDNLDLRPYIAETAPKGEGAAGAATNKGWSTEPIDASALRGFNANLDFAANRIFVRDLTIGKSALTLNVKTGVLTADLKEINLYQGQGKGVVTLDASGTQARIASNLTLNGLDLATFMHDAAKTDKLEGTGTFNFAVRGTGRSQRDIMQSLAGTAAIDFKNGALKGVDLVKIAGIVNSLIGKKTATNEAQTQSEAEAQTAEAQADTDKTRFVAMGGNFAIAGGVASTDDFKMLNDLVSLSGTGSIDLVEQSIDFRVDPGRNQKDGGLKVGLLIKGPLSKPKITPDMSGLIKNELDKALDKALEKLLGGKESSELGPTGETGATQEPAKSDPAKDAAKQILQGLFGQ